MLTIPIIAAAKIIAAALLLVILPLGMLSFVLPQIDFSLVAQPISSIVGVFVWLFGREAYNFFVATIILTTFFVPGMRITTFVLHVFFKARKVF